MPSVILTLDPKQLFNYLHSWTFPLGSTLKKDVGTWTYTVFIYGAEYKGKNESKKKRKVLRGQKKRKEDKKQQKEGVTYGAGEF